MDVVSVDTGADWSHQFTCGRCDTVAIAGPGDLEADEFKVSGYFFAGTAVCERLLFVTCPTCSQLSFLDEEAAAAVPFLLSEAATTTRHERNAPT